MKRRWRQLRRRRLVFQKMRNRLKTNWIHDRLQWKWFLHDFSCMKHFNVDEGKTQKPEPRQIVKDDDHIQFHYYGMQISNQKIDYYIIYTFKKRIFARNSILHIFACVCVPNRKINKTCFTTSGSLLAWFLCRKHKMFGNKIVFFSALHFFTMNFAKILCVTLFLSASFSSIFFFLFIYLFFFCSLFVDFISWDNNTTRFIVYRNFLYNFVKCVKCKLNKKPRRGTTWIRRSSRKVDSNFNVQPNI